MSEEQRIAVIRDLYNEIWVNGSFDRVADVLHPEIVWSAIGSAPDAGTRRGYAECRAYMEDWREDFEIHPGTIELAAVGADGWLICDQEARTRGKASGVETTLQYSAAYRFAADGRISEIREYATTQEALAASGPSK